MTGKERAVIDTLRTELDVRAEDARAVEADVLRLYAARSSCASAS